MNIQLSMVFNKNFIKDLGNFDYYEKYVEYKFVRKIYKIKSQNYFDLIILALFNL